MFFVRFLHSHNGLLENRFEVENCWYQVLKKKKVRKIDIFKIYMKTGYKM